MSRLPRTLFEDEPPQHLAKRERPHVAQEYRDLGDHDKAEYLVHHLLPWAQDCALGLNPELRKGITR